MKLLGVGVLELICGRPTLALTSALVTRPNNYEQHKQYEKNKKKKAKRAAGIEGQVATLRESLTTQIDTLDTAAMKRARKDVKEKTTERNQNKSAA